MKGMGTQLDAAGDEGECQDKQNQLQNATHSKKFYIQLINPLISSGKRNPLELLSMTDTAPGAGRAEPGALTITGAHSAILLRSPAAS
jgi:hypothetical protein